MVSCFSLSSTAFLILFLVGSTLAAHLADKLRSLSPHARDLLKRSAVPPAPRFFAYNDRFLSAFPPASQLAGFNVFALAFLLTTGPTDQAQSFAQLPPSQRSALLQEYNEAGISLIVSAFGSTQQPTTSGEDPVALANTMAAWVKQYSLQGIDVDYEDFDAFDGNSGTAEPWLIKFTQTLRANLPQGQYIISHAPVAPWFTPNRWSGGGYLTIDRTVGSLIDWYNIQFYNQGWSEYTTCQGLLFASSSNFPQSSLFEISKNGVPLDKLVIGKPGTPADAGSGFMESATLASCVGEASTAGWTGGVMLWQFPNVGSPWILEVAGGL